MKTRNIPTALLAVVLVMLAQTTVPATASATAACVLGTVTVSPSTVVIGVTQPKTQTFAVKATNCSPATFRNWGVHVNWMAGQRSSLIENWMLSETKATYLGGNVYSFKATHTDQVSDMHNSLAEEMLTTYAEATDGHGQRLSTKVAPSLDYQRQSALTTNASPEPIKKYRTLTVQGRLTRANWKTRSYAGYTYQQAQLEFRTPNGPWGTVIKTDQSDAHGYLKTTVTATHDGCYRWSFKANDTTSAGASVGDCIDVQ